MNKLLIIFIILLSSCAVDFKTIPQVVNAIIYKTDIPISRDFYLQQDYSFAKVNIGRNRVLIFVLESIHKNGDYQWISSNNDLMITRNGKIINFLNDEGMGFSYQALSANFDFNELTRISYNFLTSGSNILLSQDAIFSIYDKPDYIGIFDDESLVTKTTVIEESVKTLRYTWKFQNKYWLNSAGEVLQSEQFVHPNIPKLEIKYFYRY